MNVQVYLIEKNRTLPSGKQAAYYVLRWFATDGREQQESIGRTRKSGGDITRADAEKQRRQKQADINSDVISRDKPRKMTLSEFIAWHEKADAFGKRPATVSEWRYAGNHAVDALGDVAIDKLTMAHTGCIRDHLAVKGLSPATIRKTLGVLRGMFNTAARFGVLHRNPLVDRSGKMKLGPVPKREPRIYSTADVEAMIDTEPGIWWEAIIRLAFTTGLRRNELLHLRWSDVDTDAGIVHVQPRQATRTATAAGSVPILPWSPKTATGRRSVPLPPETIAVVLRLKMQAGDSPYLFIDLQRLQWLDRRQQDGKLHAEYEPVANFTRDYNAIQTVAAITPAGCFHDMRKSFGTRCATAGMPPHELRHFMGHAKITTTMEFYTAVVEDTARSRLLRVTAA